MKSRVEKNNRDAAIKLRDDAIVKLKEQNRELQKEICELREELMCVNGHLMREMAINESLVKHSHILFDALSKSQKKNSKHLAVKPTLDDLEDIFKDVLP